MTTNVLKPTITENSLASSAAVYVRHKKDNVKFTCRNNQWEIKLKNHLPKFQKINSTHLNNVKASKIQSIASISIYLASK